MKENEERIARERLNSSPSWLVGDDDDADADAENEDLVDLNLNR